MKALNKILYILTVVFGVASLVLFFTDFVNLTLGTTEDSLVGTVIAFGSKANVAGTEYNMSASSDILFCFLLTVISAVMGALSFKSKKLRYAVPFVGIIAAVYMFVIYGKTAWHFVDTRPLVFGDISVMTFTPFVLFTAIALALFTVASAAYLLVDDYLEVLASDGEKLTICKRLVRFFKDYKSETKKIVWPGIKDVIKNTVIVIIICLLVGALIWLVDFGLGKLLGLILGI